MYKNPREEKVDSDKEFKLAHKVNHAGKKIGDSFNGADKSKFPNTVKII